MKKMITVILTVVMMLTAMTCCYAEIGDETFGIDNNTMLVSVDNTIYHFELIEASVDEDGVVYATYIEENAEYALIIAMDSWLGVDEYYAEDQCTDVMAYLLLDSEGNEHYSSCFSESVDEMKYSDLVLTVSDEDGWYQGGMIGYTRCEETGEVCYIEAVFDFTVE